jgi:hypothetical protein
METGVSKMKKLLTFLIGLIVLCSVISVPMPMPVKGFITQNNAPVNADVVVTNKATGEVLTVANVPSLKTEEGVFMFDMSEFKNGVGFGNTIEIKVCPESSCIKNFNVDYNDFPKKIYFDLDASATPSGHSIVTPPVTQITCPDGSKADKLSDCPPIVTPPVEPPVTPPVKITCPDGTEVEKAEDCPVEPPVIIQVTCPDGSKADSLDKCPEVPSGIAVIIIAAVSIVIAGLGALFLFDKKKFKWAPGMAGIMNKTLKEYKQAIKDGDKAKAEKLGNTLMKYSGTITTKYLQSLDTKDLKK